MTALNEASLLKHIRSVAPENLLGDLIQPGHPLFGLVWINRGRVGGTPCFFGTRVPIKTLFDCLAAGETIEQFLNEFEGVEREQAQAILELAGSRLLNDLLKPARITGAASATKAIPLGYERTDLPARRRRARWVRWKALRVYVAIVLLAIAIGAGWRLALRYDNRQGVSLEKCPTNLRRIGVECEMYAVTNGGNFPSSLNQVTSLTNGELICPDSGDVPPHVSYAYVGVGVRLSDPKLETIVIAFEPLANHKNTGSHFLFADGHVEWFGPKEAMALIRATFTAMATRPPR